MKSRRFLLLLPSFFLLLFACAPWGERLPEHVLARVGEEEITVDEFDREFRELILEPGGEGKSPDLRELKRVYLDQMIERKLLAQEAKRQGIHVSTEELNRTLLEIKKDYPGEGFGEKLGLKGMTLEEWRGRLEEKLLAEKMIGSALRYRGEIEEREAREYYETHVSSFYLKPRVRARQIVVADGEEAIQILKRLKKGESFEKLAAEKSLGPEKAKGGDLGLFSQGERPVEFDHLFTMEVGSISEVIRSPYGYHLFKLEEKIEGGQIPFEEARTRIQQDLSRKKGEEQFQKWFKSLRGKAKITINEKGLRS